MTILTQRYLDSLAWSLGQTLPGAGHPDVFIGTREGLTAEVGRLFALPVPAGGPVPMSYTDALSVGRWPPASVAAAMDHLRHQPILRFYLRSADPVALANALRRELPPGDVDSIEPMAMGEGVSLVSSLEAARRALAHPLVSAWQVPGALVAEEGRQV